MNTYKTLENFAVKHLRTMRQVKKRNGVVDNFTPEKITNAMQKAFMARGTNISSEKLSEMTQKIVSEIDRRFPEQTPSVEHIQDIVELCIMGEGYHEVAKAYIIYRYEHTK